MDNIGSFGFGYSLNLLRDDTNAFMLPGMSGSNYRNNVYIQAPMVKWLGVEPFFLGLWRVRVKYLFLLRRLVKARLSEGKDAKEDLFSYVVDAKDPESGTGINVDELWTEATFFIGAGGDTAAAAIAAVLFYLSRNPETYSKLAAEIRKSFSSGSDIQSGAQLSSCIYLRAVIDEAMRLSPPVPTTLWRELPVGDNGSKQPLIIDGHTVPAGTWVGVNTYTIHHNEEYFPDPFAFRPERWLADSSDASYKSPHMQAAFSPFGVGSRSCAGKAMAYMEMSLVIAKTVWYFDFERVRGDRLDRIGEGKKGDRYGRGRVEKYQLYDQFVATHEGPYLRFRPRDGVCRDLE